MQKPYLIQRMKFKGDKLGTIDETFALDYMGSSEFEFGALPKSLKQMCKNIGNIGLHKMDSIKSFEGEPLYIIATEPDADSYRKFMPELAKNNIRLKEFSGFDIMVSGEDFRGNKRSRVNYSWVDVWWDIENQVMFTFGKDNAEMVFDSILSTRAKKEKQQAEGWY